MARLITDFELWQPGYANAVVTYYVGASDTLADLYYDEAETEPAPNPVTLASWEDDCCNSYGRFSQPIYIDAVSYSVEEGQKSGEFRTDIPLKMAVDMLCGPIIFRMLSRPEEITQIFQRDFPCPFHRQCATSFSRPFLLPQNDPLLCAPAHTRQSPITSAQLPRSLCCSRSVVAGVPVPPSNAGGCWQPHAPLPP